ncbi:hypothetical protein FA13DRAFT_1802584 [Coprinellus micaceus]|uniref:Uncharacterized protein n=1 Tax=Coprinellus micaceus TaxID=71717 RepID=A0A4Y7SBS6_COPMI|nr:hypothetical protein FA13DRAFT_1802584 [Coprinellus micaceus]
MPTLAIRAMPRLNRLYHIRRERGHSDEDVPCGRTLAALPVTPQYLSVDEILQESAQPVLVVILRCDEFDETHPETLGGEVGTLDVLIGGKSQRPIAYRSLLEYWMSAFLRHDLELITSAPWAQRRPEGDGGECDPISSQPWHLFYVQAFYPAAAFLIAGIWAAFAWKELMEDAESPGIEEDAQCHLVKPSPPPDSGFMMTLVTSRCDNYDLPDH